MHGSCFICDHEIVSFLVNIPSVANHQDKLVTFGQPHKINIDGLKDDLAASAFVAYLSHNIDTLSEQYMSSLSDLLDIHSPIKMRRLTKATPDWITNEFRTSKCLLSQ